MTIAFTRFTLGFHILLERLWEWETLMPNVTPLPQISHFANCCTSNHRKKHPLLKRHNTPQHILTEIFLKCKRKIAKIYIFFGDG